MLLDMVSNSFEIHVLTKLSVVIVAVVAAVIAVFIVVFAVAL